MLEVTALKAAGYKGAIGMEMSPKGDPLTAFKAVREADAEARRLAGA